MRWRSSCSRITCTAACSNAVKSGDGKRAIDEALTVVRKFAR